MTSGRKMIILTKKDGGNKRRVKCRLPMKILNGKEHGTRKTEMFL